MAEITASMVKELREKTGAGMMQCKQALTEAGGDIDEAIKVLRKKGLAAAGKKAGRATTEGAVEAHTTASAAVLIEVNCETDFVSKNEDFRDLVGTLARMIVSEGIDDREVLLEQKYPGDPEGHTVEQMISMKIAKIGENLSVRRFERMEAGDGEVFGSYIHSGGRVGVLVKMKVDGGDKGAWQDTARQVAMHAAALDPRFTRRDEVTQKDLDTEKEIAREQALKSGKPEDLVDKIVSGKMEKFYGESVLLEQPFVRDDKVTVEGFIERQGKNIGGTGEVVRFVRYKLGEGLEKKADDFAAEVAKQAGLA
jgi:elongation factor Ts